MAHEEGSQLMNTSEAADLLGLSVGRVRQLAIDGKLRGERVGRDWVFVRSVVEEFARRPRRRGRPNKV